MGFSDELARDTSDVFRVQGWNTIFDKQSMGGGCHLKAKITEGLIAADIFVCIISDDSINSDWQEDELRAFICLKETSPALQVIPISDRVSADRIPAWYTELIGPDVLKLEGSPKDVFEKDLRKMIARYELDNK